MEESNTGSQACLDSSLARLNHLYPTDFAGDPIFDSSIHVIYLLSVIQKDLLRNELFRSVLTEYLQDLCSNLFKASCLTLFSYSIASIIFKFVLTL